MKKIILTTAIILTAFVGAFAQSSANANLSVTINPIQTIQVINPDVNLSYSTTKHYDEGVSSEQDNHLKIYSTGAFQVKVVATDLEAAGTTEKIPASSITVKADNGSKNPLDNIGGNAAIDLPTGTAKTLFTSTSGGVDRNVKITYQGKGGNEYINKFFKGAGEKQNVYKTTVTYSIEAN